LCLQKSAATNLITERNIVCTSYYLRLISKPKMSDIDPCECVDIFNHESAMRRLINLLRDSQNACTDGGCEELPGNPGMPAGTDGYMMLMLGWVVVATMLYFMRPNSMRPALPEKPSPSSGDGPPPPPPPAVN